jgi:hypothetical protein
MSVEEHEVTSLLNLHATSALSNLTTPPGLSNLSPQPACLLGADQDRSLLVSADQRPEGEDDDDTVNTGGDNNK